MDINILDIRQKDRLRTSDGVQYIVKSLSRDGRVIRADLVEGVGAKVALICETDYLAAHFASRVNAQFTQVMTVADFASRQTYVPRMNLDNEIAEADRVYHAAQALATAHDDTVVETVQTAD